MYKYNLVFVIKSSFREQIVLFVSLYNRAPGILWIEWDQESAKTADDIKENLVI